MGSGRVVRGPGGERHPSSPADELSLSIGVAGPVRTLEELHRHLDVLLEEGPRTVVVDMSAAGRASSTTIAALLWTQHRCSSRHVEVRLRSTPREWATTLRRIGLAGSLVIEGPGARTGSQGPGQPKLPGARSRSGSRLT